MSSQNVESLYGSLVLPRDIISIKSNTFKDCRNLIDIEIPNSVESVGSSILSGCDSLQYNEFGDCLYLGNPKNPYVILVKVKSTDITSCVVKDGTKFIYDEAFRDCRNLTSIVIPSSVTSVGYRAFYNCNNITEAVMPTTAISSIPKSELQSVIINGGESIGYQAFQYCSSLTSVVISSSVKSIEYQAFYKCTNLASIYIPSTIMIIKEYAFRDCSSLTIYCEAESKPSEWDNWWNYDFRPVRWGCKEYGITENGIEWILSNDDTVKIVKADKTVTQVEIPSIIKGCPVTSIVSYAFDGCSSLKSVVIPSSVTKIGYEAFYGCSGLESITLPFTGGSASATEASESTLFGYIFGTRDYDGGVSIKQYYGSGSLSKWYCIPSSLKRVTITGSKLLYGAFSGCSSLTSIVIPSSLTSIDDNAFLDCSNLVDVYYLGDLADWCEISFGSNSSNPMRYASNLYIGETLITGDLIIPDEIMKIGNYAFSGCSSLTSIVIPDSVKEIGYSAFNGCSGLESMVIPFVGDRNYTYSPEVSPNTVFGYIFGADSYDDGTRILQIYNSAGSTYYYIPSNLRNITITSCTIIVEQSFYNCTPLTNVVLPNNLTTIEAGAFSGCANLQSIVIPISVTTMGASAFYGCKNTTIYCESNGKPSGWDLGWNFNGGSVVWNYKG